MFTNDMSKSASTVSLSILVVIEMFNAINALSSSESLLTFFLGNNPMLIYAIPVSMRDKTSSESDQSISITHRLAPTRADSREGRVVLRLSQENSL